MCFLGWLAQKVSQSFDCRVFGGRVMDGSHTS